MGYPERKFDGIRLDNPDGNSKVFSFGTTEGGTLGLIDNTMLGVADYSKLENQLSLMNQTMKESRI